MNRMVCFVAGCIIVTAASLHAEDVYYYLPLNELIQQQQLDKLKGEPNEQRSFYNRTGGMMPYTVGNKQEELYIIHQRELTDDFAFMIYFDGYSIGQYSVAISCKKGVKPSGLIFLPTRQYSKMIGFDFAVTKESADQNSTRDKFFRAKECHYRDLLDLGIPGGAWFRHQMLEARFALKKSGINDANLASDNNPSRRQWRNRESDTDRTYDLMSGGRAVSENLQLDRQLRTTADNTYTVDINSIQGITTLPVDWKSLIRDIKPQKDFLAAYIPADQHVIFFPSFAAMLKVTDRADAESMPILAMLGRSEDEQTKVKYDRQLCLSTDALSRLLGPKLIRSMAFTGSDPYLRVGSDVAVLFEAVDPTILMSTISARQKTSAGDAQSVKGTIDGIEYSGVVSPDRSICSYLAAVDKAVIVTNSLYQLAQIIKASKGQVPATASADEYTFFRNRYKIGEPNETGFLVLSDATIRRWCSPRWRIADARRTCVGASLAELQARYLDELASGNVKTRALDADIAGAGHVRLTSAGVVSDNYGGLSFMTPIAELKLGKATRSEMQAYERFRNNYQNQWRQFFDPIALRFFVDGDKLAFNLTIRPLIVQSEYNQFIQITGHQQLGGFAGDKHNGTIMHAILAVDPNSSSVRRFGSFASQMAPALQIEPFSWVGKWITLYADDDPYWTTFAKMAESGDYHQVENNLNRLPLALQVDVASPIKLAVFLTAIRSFAEQSAPGMLIWQTINYNGQPYVKVGADPNQSHGMPNFAIYYCATPKSLIITLNEPLLERAIDRAKNVKSASGSAKSETIKPWLGSSMNLQVRPEAAAAIREIFGTGLRQNLADKSWQNIIILNEWHQRYPNMSPVEFHQRFWQTKLVCPGGGKYVWNDKLKTVESTVFGSPANPGKSAQTAETIFDVKTVDFGLTFEDGGLNAAAELGKAGAVPIAK